MLISIPPVIIEGETKTTLFPWYVYPPVEPFVARMLAETVGRTATFFFVVDLTMSITVLASHLYWLTTPLCRWSVNPSYLSSRAI